MSNNFTNKTALCTAVMVCPLLAFLSHADGHTPWLVAALQALLAVIAALVVIVVATLIVALITDIPRYIANRRENRTRLDIEQRFPGTRATPLKSGHWLLTEPRANADAHGHVITRIPAAWKTTEPSVSVRLTDDPSLANHWQASGFDVVELFD
jgi:hypothetical protein